MDKSFTNYAKDIDMEVSVKFRKVKTDGSPQDGWSGVTLTGIHPIASLRGQLDEAFYQASRTFTREMQEEDSNKQGIKAVRDTLAEARLQLNSLHGLLAADAEAPDVTFAIDNLGLLNRINEADDILANFE